METSVDCGGCGKREEIGDVETSVDCGRCGKNHVTIKVGVANTHWVIYALVLHIPS